jgi:hypothetical protein
MDKLALLNEMLDQIERLMTGRRKSAAMWPYDTKTPLNAALRTWC